MPGDQLSHAIKSRKQRVAPIVWRGHRGPQRRGFGALGWHIEFFAGFQSGETAGTRALLILSGLVSVAFGVLLFARPGVGAVTLALLFGLYSLIYGFSQITAGIQVRHLGGDVRSLSELRSAA